MGNIKTHKDLRVFQLSFEAGMMIFKLTKLFPKEEMYSLTDQIRRSSRSVSGNLQKLGEKEDMKRLLWQNYQIVKVKLQKPKFG